ncbi:hypothetical protein RND81_01G125700 [Saponaria officinalis]|uniref:MORF/ORRM1/DAG-like MORF domain-containing protein n=1 Tax=Saponaria officinalis TaxID=3572 RepID=A0AAW1NF38_SAPOF
MASSTVAKTLTTLSLRRTNHPITTLKRLFSTIPITITRPPPLPLTRPARPTLLISDPAPFSATRFETIRCRVNRSGPYSPRNNNSGGSNFSDRPPTEIAPLFPGCDYEHWLIVMDKPGGEGADKQQMIDCYVQTLSKVVGRYMNSLTFCKSVL